MQKGANANNIKNILFIIVGFYRLPPTLELPLIFPLLLLDEEPLLKLPLLLEEELLGLLILELLLLLDEELLGLLTLELLLLEEELLGLLILELLLLEEELLGLTYSELERTCLLLFAGVYDLRSVDADDDGLTLELLLDGRAVLDGRELLDGRAELDGLELLDGRAELDGLALLEGLEEGDGDIPADTGLLVVPATCNPPCPFGRPEGLGAGASPPLGCGL